jgi:hypothetical protein
VTVAASAARVCRAESPITNVALVEGANIVRRESGLPEAPVRAADPRLCFATAGVANAQPFTLLRALAKKAGAVPGRPRSADPWAALRKDAPSVEVAAERDRERHLFRHIHRLSWRHVVEKRSLQMPEPLCRNQPMRESWL